MKFPFYIAKRYLHSKSSNNAINFITLIAIVGVIFGAASLFVVLSGFSGLKDFTLEFSTVLDPDLKAVPASGKSFELDKESISKLKAVDGIEAFSEIVEERIIISTNNKNCIATLKGVDEAYQNIAVIDSILDSGNWFSQYSTSIVVGWGIANQLGLGILDFSHPLNIYVPKPGKGQITSTKNAFNSITVTNVGIFYINESLNNNYIFAPKEMAQALLNYKPNQITGLEFKIKNPKNIEATKQTIKNILGDAVILKNKIQLNDALYKMLNTENLAVYLIFTLVLIIAFFNIIGSLIMMILDKKQSLNTLFNIGATVTDIRKIFFLQGSLMTLIGGLIGIALGSLLVVLQQHFALLMITPSLPYPVALKWENFFIAFTTIFVLGLLASKLAATRITKHLIAN